MKTGHRSPTPSLGWVGAAEVIAKGDDSVWGVWGSILGADALARIVQALDNADPVGVFPRLAGLERQRAALESVKR